MQHRRIIQPQRWLSWLLGSAAACLSLPAWVAPVTTEAAPAAAAAAAPAPALELARNWQPRLDPSAFLVSEKLDGVRAFWDGQTLRFRSGRRIAAPDWFTSALPDTPLDGELWLGRGRFDQLSGRVRRSTPVDAEWRELRFMVFDLPGAAGSFAERTLQLTARVAEAGQPWLQAVAQQPGTDRAALQRHLIRLVADGAEGLVLHRADALWQPGRSAAVYKLKPLPDDEARVLAHLPGKGRNAARMGALLLQLPDGQRFALGSGFSDAQRENPPPLGAMVSFRYRSRTPSGLPRFASFLRVREAE